MIVMPGALAPPAGRLLLGIAARGEPILEAARLPAGEEPVTLALADGPFVLDLAGLVAALGRRPFRLLVLSRLGAHPDARAESLQRLWRIEEHARGAGAPVLTLRLAPLIGPHSPLWRKLASSPKLPRRGRQLLNPVAESDALESLARALDGRAQWRGWFEVAGPEVWSLAELAEAAARSGVPHAGGAFEPDLDELAEHRLAEAGPWQEHFGIEPTAIETAGRGRAA